MKNITGKTLIFYTFQQKKQLQYNVIAYQSPKQPILIMHVIQQLPIKLSEGQYHFRFKSQFVEENQKMVGWIDINNLIAKAPSINGSIYVKILKVKSSPYNKMFNLENLSKVGLGNVSKTKSRQSTSSQKDLNPQSINSPVKVKPIQPLSTSNSSEQPGKVQNTQKKAQQTKMRQKQPKNLPQNSPLASGLKKQIIPIIKLQPIKKSDLIQFEKPQVYVNNQTPEQTLARIRQIMLAQEQQKLNQLIARDQLQEKINKWGYAGPKTINNLTTLLSTLHNIWPEWPEISLSQLLKQQKLAEHSKRALIKTHPDKNRKKPFRQRYLSKRVFELLSEARKPLGSV